MITLRFNGASRPARWITLKAVPVQPVTAREAARAILTEAPFHERAAKLARVAAEAFPQDTWRRRVVRPAERLTALTPDMQLQVLRALCPGVEVLHGL